ncbi:MAG TPA: pyruvate, phosphate dikinase [Patescibacteria group bacterium]|nr:pyruvate, phosphate dikinase [Patescibacteria group bacterium]
MSEKKYVFAFEEGNKDLKEILGGKGANLAEMSSLGIKVPPGFTISTEVCDVYYQNNKQHPQEVKDQISEKLSQLEEKMGKKLGDSEDPLLVSVRSGAAASMPGMMDTILNLGINDQVVEGLVKKTGNEKFAWDSYRRLIQMFGDVVLGVAHHEFEQILENIKDTNGVQYDMDLSADNLKEVVRQYREKIKEVKGVDFPQDPREQLQLAIDAVFNSWQNNRAIRYREINNIKGLIGTAVNVQAMVFGNLGENSGTGVCFTRNPSNGENKFYGEYLMNAQGEDVVAGIRTPKPISELGEQMPEIYQELVDTCQKVEDHYRDMQDMEFTIENGKLYILQTRNGKRTTTAAVNIAVDLVSEGKLSKEEALLKIDPNQLDQLLHKQIDPMAKEASEVVAQGLPASPGAAVGKVVFTAQEAFDQAQEGMDVILVRVETSPEDIDGMHSAKGILTARGGMTSHAAVVARGMGTCCVAGCSDVEISEKEKQFTIKGSDIVVKEGDFITLDGTDGKVYLGKVTTRDPEMSGNFNVVMNWADAIRSLGVRTNADTPYDATVARKFGAEGIGLCRTEHMFFEGDRIKAVREMILSSDEAGRKKALDKLLPYQKEDFIGIFHAMDGFPVTVRLLDPPLHEFLPQEEKDIFDLAREMEIDVGTLKAKISDLHEFNPMLGHRGCRLAITYPEIYDMQVTAIIEAAIEVARECPKCGRASKVMPEIMIPLVGHVKELSIIKQRVIDIVDQKIKEAGIELSYKVGTMIEVPRAAVTADEIAKEADFFSFGTNDLTQMGAGFSRDDAGRFLKEYVSQGIYDRDPFQSLDQSGIGELIRIAISKGRGVKSDLKIGICGEHGGDPESVEFCHREGFNYVSCSPFRVPIARLAAAQAVIKTRNK